MKALQVANWSRFEPSDSRKCKSMQWVAVPINHNGLGYLEVMSHPDGIRMIGGWLLILQVAAQCPTRGLLVADSGRILGAREIALKTRSQEKDITDCIALLLENGWLEEVESSGHHPDIIRTSSGLQDRTVQDRTVQDRTVEAAPHPPAPRLKDEWRLTKNEPWARALQAAGCLGFPKDWLAWQGVVDRCGGHESVAIAAQSLPPNKRYHDQVEAASAKPAPKSFSPELAALCDELSRKEPNAG